MYCTSKYRKYFFMILKLLSLAKIWLVRSIEESGHGCLSTFELSFRRHLLQQLRVVQRVMPLLLLGERLGQVLHRIALHLTVILYRRQGVAITFDQAGWDSNFGRLGGDFQHLLVKSVDVVPGQHNGFATVHFLQESFEAF